MVTSVELNMHELPYYKDLGIVLFRDRGCLSVFLSNRLVDQPFHVND